jgi:hypothetical protein
LLLEQDDKRSAIGFDGGDHRLHYRQAKNEDQIADTGADFSVLLQRMGRDEKRPVQTSR